MLCILFVLYAHIYIYFSTFEMNYYYFSFDESQFTFSGEQSCKRQRWLSVRKGIVKMDSKGSSIPNNLSE